MSRRQTRDIANIIRDGTAIDGAIVAAHRRVILRHRQLGVPLAIWRDGQVVEVSPESVDLPADGGARFEFEDFEVGQIGRNRRTQAESAGFAHADGWARIDSPRWRSDADLS